MTHRKSYSRSRLRVKGIFLLLLGVHSATSASNSNNNPTYRKSKFGASLTNNNGNVPAGAILGFDSSSKKPRTLDDGKIPSLFRSDEKRYDKFAACLAATGMTVEEFQSLSLSLHRNSELFDKVMAQAYLYRMAAKKESKRSNLFGQNLLQRSKQQLEQKQQQSQKVVPKGRKGSKAQQAKKQKPVSKTSTHKSHRRPKNSFSFFGENKKRNGRSSEAEQGSPQTKTNKTVMNIISSNNKAKLHQQELLQQQLQLKQQEHQAKISKKNNNKTPQKKKTLPPAPPVRTRFDEFCSSIAEIEELRIVQRNKLQHALQIDRFPVGLTLSDPAVSPFLSPKVRAVVDAFPLQAEEIVKKHGLKSDEFNELMEETRNNRFFRRKVESKIRKLTPKQKQQQVDLKKLSKRVSVEKKFHLDEPAVVATPNIAQDDDPSSSTVIKALDQIPSDQKKR